MAWNVIVIRLACSIDPVKLMNMFARAAAGAAASDAERMDLEV